MAQATDGVGFWWHARCRLLGSFDVQFTAITGPSAMVVAMLGVDQGLMPVLLQEAGRSIGFSAKCASGGSIVCLVGPGRKNQGFFGDPDDISGQYFRNP